MNVRDLDEFMADIDEWVLDDIERWEDEKGRLKYLIFKMKKPFAEQMVDVQIGARKITKQNAFTDPKRNKAYTFGAKSYFELVLDMGQDESIPAEALHSARESLMDSDVDRVKDVIDSQYQIEVMFQ